MKKSESKKVAKSTATKAPAKANVTKGEKAKVAKPAGAGDIANVADQAPEATTGTEAAPIAAPVAQERGGAANAGAAQKKAKPAKAKKAPAEPKAKKTSGLDAAAQVLKEAGQPMNAQAMVETMLAKGMWKTGGKTPASTIYAAIIREIALKADQSRFKKTDRGLFAFNG